MASDRVIDEIKSRIDTVDFIGRYVSLKQSGRSYKALCPFHQEDTPSFVVFPHTDTWHCFGSCGEGGDIFNFVQKIEGLEFGEALEMLAREAGVELRPLDQAAMEAREKRDRLQDVCEAAAQQFVEWLRESPSAQHCRDYIEQRHIDPETARTFQLGYALDQWEGLLQTLSGRGYKPKDLEAAGLIIERDSGGYYDRFRNRLVFPIRDIRGRVVGFGGRVLSDEDQPKYLNSPQTEIFDKSRVLYGLDLAKDAIRDRDRVVVVEGYMDVIAAHQAGHRNVVASLGTALTGQQLKLIKRFSKNVTLALDADDAGTEATKRGVEAAREALDRRFVPRVGQRGRIQQTQELDGELRILRLPDGYDPDDLLQEDAERWTALVSDALPVVDYFFDMATRGRDLSDIQQKKIVANELLPIIADIGNVVERAHYLQQLSNTLRVSERDLNTQLLQLLRQRPRRRRQTSGPPEAPPHEDEVTTPTLAASDVQNTEAYVLYVLTQHTDWMSQALEKGLSPDDFNSTQNRAIFEALLQEMPDSAPAMDALIEDMAPTLASRLEQIIARYQREPEPPQEELEEDFFEMIDVLKIRATRRACEQLQHVISDMQNDPGHEKDRLSELRTQFYHLTQQILSRERALRARKGPRSDTSAEDEEPAFL